MGKDYSPYMHPKQAAMRQLRCTRMEPVVDLQGSVYGKKETYHSKGIVHSACSSVCSSMLSVVSSVNPNTYIREEKQHFVLNRQ